MLIFAVWSCLLLIAARCIGSYACSSRLVPFLVHYSDIFPLLSLTLHRCVYLCLSAHKLYPVRIRLVNVEGEIEWFTVAYIPVIKTLKEPNGDERARVRRSNLLQRVLYLVFRTAIAASHKGFEVPLPCGQTARAFPRVLLYICDQPEERAVLCFKSVGSARPCSSCTVAAKDMVSAAALTATDRDVVQSLEKQLEAAELFHSGDDRRRRLVIEGHESINSAIPALASLAGLSTPPLLLYKMVGFDVLHVLDVGVTKMLVRRLMRIFAFVCKGTRPKYKSRAALARAAFRRLFFLGRRSQARRAPPG